jgi:hypothetical protein
MSRLGVLDRLWDVDVTALFDDADPFGAYAIGLAVGFFAYLILSLSLGGRDIRYWMGGD